MSLGYSLALFSVDNSNKLRQWAQKADEKGNNNGLLDGEEIEIFKRDIKNRCGYNFNFNKIKQAELKNISVYDAGKYKWKYSSTTEIAQKYPSSTTKIINAINPKEAKFEQDEKNPVNLNTYTQEHGINIAYMSEEDFKTSKASVDEQEKLYREACENLNEIELKLKQAELNEYYTVRLEGKTVIIEINEGITRNRQQIIENFGFSQMSVKKDEYKKGDLLKVSLNEFNPMKEKSLLQRIFRR